MQHNHHQHSGRWHGLCRHQLESAALRWGQSADTGYMHMSVLGPVQLATGSLQVGICRLSCITAAVYIPVRTALPC